MSEENKLVRVAIIGSAGRNGDDKWMTPEAWKYMLQETRRQITEVWKLDPKRVDLVSGGSSFADHVAVHIFVHPTNATDYRRLHLYLPCAFYGQFDGSFMCGKRLNELHKQCSQQVGIDSLSELTYALEDPKNGTVRDGFMERNTAIAENCDYLIAWSTAKGDKPKPNSGTWDTWVKCKLPADKRVLLTIPPPPKPKTIDAWFGGKRKTQPFPSKYGGQVMEWIQPLAHVEYLERFLTRSEANALFEECLKTIPWRKVGLNRQSALLGDSSYPYGKDMRYDEKVTPFPPSLKALLERINKLLPADSPKLDVGLCGLYESGKNYLGFHADIEELKAETPIASLSLGAERYFTICRMGQKDNKSTHRRILLEHGSLLMMHSEMHEHFEHAMLADAACNNARINITFRRARHVK